MLPALELTEEEVLERLKMILKGVTIVPHAILEYHGDNLPPAVSCFICASIFSSLLILSIFTFCLVFFLWLFCFPAGIGA
jgi:hypothetical protein